MAGKRILIQNARVFDGTAFSRQDVYTAEGLVAAMGSCAGLPADLVFDGTDMLLTPGLVDIHMHFYGVSCDLYGAPAESACFPFGVTAACDCGTEQGCRERLELLRLKHGVFVSVFAKDNHADFTLTRQMLEQYGAKALGVKLYLDSTVSDITDHTILRETCAFARERGLKVMVHCSHSPEPMAEIIRVLQKGDILTHAYHGGAHTCQEENYAALRLAREKGVVIDLGMAGHVHTDFALLQQAIREGHYPDVVSTDLTNWSLFTRGGHYGLLLCMSVLREMGMPEQEILQAVTTRAAAAVGMPDWGRLSVGAAADLALLSWEPGPYDFAEQPHNRFSGSHSYRCRLTLCDGQVVYRSR